MKITQYFVKGQLLPRAVIDSDDLAKELEITEEQIEQAINIIKGVLECDLDYANNNVIVASFTDRNCELHYYLTKEFVFYLNCLDDCFIPNYTGMHKIIDALKAKEKRNSGARVARRI